MCGITLDYSVYKPSRTNYSARKILEGLCQEEKEPSSEQGAEETAGEVACVVPRTISRLWCIHTTDPITDSVPGRRIM